jgi:hypothetical protein
LFGLSRADGSNTSEIPLFSWNNWRRFLHTQLAKEAKNITRVLIQSDGIV